MNSGNLLAVDISTSVIGWSLWKISEKKLLDQGFIKLTNSKGEPKDLDDRLDIALKEIKNLNLQDITKIAVEAAFLKFSGGSNANTIAKLVAMNFALTYTLTRLWNVEAKYLSVSEARRLFGIKITRQPKGQKKDANWAKKIVISEVARKYPMISLPVTASGNPKKGTDDLADAIVIGYAALSKND